MDRMFLKIMNPPKSSILTGFSIIFTIHFGVPLFLETPHMGLTKKKRPNIIEKGYRVSEVEGLEDAPIWVACVMG